MTHLQIAEISANEFIIQSNKPRSRYLGNLHDNRVTKAEGRAVTRAARLKATDRAYIVKRVVDFCSSPEDGKRFAARVKKCATN
jgi:hypothetical protein